MMPVFYYYLILMFTFNQFIYIFRKHVGDIHKGPAQDFINIRPLVCFSKQTNSLNESAVVVNETRHTVNKQDKFSIRLYPHVNSGTALRVGNQWRRDK